MVYFISTREIQFHSIPFYLFKNVDSKLFVYNLTFTARIQIIFRSIIISDFSPLFH